MTPSRTLRRGTAVAGAAFLLVAGTLMPAQAAPPRGERAACFDPVGVDAGARGGDGRDPDHRDISATEQAAIETRTAQILRGRPGGKPGATVNVPVHVHVMAAADGTGDVTDQQIAEQVAVLNRTYGGAESTEAAATGFTFTLAGVDRYYDDAWHNDKQSNVYRKATRQGGADALNMWLVEFGYLGIATFPWDYANQGAVDGVRVLWSSLPGGTETNYNLGETATHEVGHWLGLYHVFQGGCRDGDEVVDTPAQSVATNGCPEGQDSCAGGGVDSIHNYMDYSYDSCYTQFTLGQATRMQQMWSAYRTV
jgi:hypothetical protein